MDSKKEKTNHIDNNSLPNRFDDVYKNIENIEDFEFTHCIIYEMARRNVYVQDTLNFLNDLFIIYEITIHDVANEYYEFLRNYKSKENENIIKSKIGVENIIKDEIQKIIKFHNKNNLVEEFEDLSLNNIKEKLYKLIKSLTDQLYEEYYIVYTNEFASSFKHIAEIYDPTNNLERDKMLTEIVNKLNLNNCKYYINNNDFFSIFQITDEYRNEMKLNIIYPKYKAAVRDFTDMKIALNLNLPKNEIIDFISKIKDNYDDKHSIIKTPLELFGEKLEIGLKDEKKKNKWADLFFIYDYYKAALLNNNKKYQIEKNIQWIFTKIYGIKIMKDNKSTKNKPNEFYLEPFKEYLKKNQEIDESDLDFDQTSDEKHYITTRSIRTKYKEIKNYIEESDPKYKTLVYR
jgi:hypothetical protein